MLVEHARDIIGIGEASHAEYGPTGTPVVSLLACSLVESQIEVEITPGSRLASIYGTSRAVERTHCSYGLDPTYAYIASNGGMSVCAIDDTGEVRAVERPDHPFFVATLYQPQRSSRPEAPHPILTEFIRTVLA